MFARFVGKLYAEAAAFGAADVECQENPSFFVMISRAGGVVKRMEDDWGRRTPGVAILRQQMGGCGTQGKFHLIRRKQFPAGNCFRHLPLHRGRGYACGMAAGLLPAGCARFVHRGTSGDGTSQPAFRRNACIPLRRGRWFFAFL